MALTLNMETTQSGPFTDDTGPLAAKADNVSSNTNHDHYGSNDACHSTSYNASNNSINDPSIHAVNYHGHKVMVIYSVNDSLSSSDIDDLSNSDYDDSSSEQSDSDSDVLGYVDSDAFTDSDSDTFSDTDSDSLIYEDDEAMSYLDYDGLSSSELHDLRSTSDYGTLSSVSHYALNNKEDENGNDHDIPSRRAAYYALNNKEDENGNDHDIPSRRAAYDAMGNRDDEDSSFHKTDKDATIFNDENVLNKAYHETVSSPYSAISSNEGTRNASDPCIGDFIHSILAKNDARTPNVQCTYSSPGALSTAGYDAPILADYHNTGDSRNKDNFRDYDASTFEYNDVLNKIDQKDSISKDKHTSSKSINREADNFNCAEYDATHFEDNVGLNSAYREVLNSTDHGTSSNGDSILADVGARALHGQRNYSAPKTLSRACNYAIPRFHKIMSLLHHARSLNAKFGTSISTLAGQIAWSSKGHNMRPSNVRKLNKLAISVLRHILHIRDRDQMLTRKRKCGYRRSHA